MITGIGYYPNLGVKDAFLLVTARRYPDRGAPVRRASTRTGSTSTSATTASRSSSRCTSCGSSSTRPRASPPISPGKACSTSSRSSAHILRAGNRVTLDAQRFAQFGSWSGHFAIDGEKITVDPATWIGSRDRSWGIRPIGEAEPAGRPGRPAVRGHVVALRADGVRRLRDRADHPGGAQRLPLAQRLHPDLEGRPRRAARLAAGEDPLPLRHPHPDRRDDRRHRRRRHAGALRRGVQAAGARSTSAAATAATRTGSTACGRARSSPNG